MRLTRRRALQLGGVIALGGGALAVRGYAPSIAGLRHLSDHQYRTLTALATALFPDGGASADLAHLFDRFLDGEPDDRRADLLHALTLLEYGPVVFEQRLKTFSDLDETARLRHFAEWTTSDSLVRRKVALAFRKFLSVVYYDRPEIWPDIGYSL